MMTGSLKKKIYKKKKLKRFFFFKLKKGGSLIRACSLIRSNTVGQNMPIYHDHMVQNSVSLTVLWN